MMLGHPATHQHTHHKHPSGKEDNKTGLKQMRFREPRECDCDTSNHKDVGEQSAPASNQNWEIRPDRNIAGSCQSTSVVRSRLSHSRFGQHAQR